jgi:hypothetical protein
MVLLFNVEKGKQKPGWSQALKNFLEMFKIAFDLIDILRQWLI